MLACYTQKLSRILVDLYLVLSYFWFKQTKQQC